MAIVFDTLAYARRLESSGVDRIHAEAHAEAVRDFVMHELVTRKDLDEALNLATLRIGTIMAGAVATGVAILGILIKLH